MAPFDPPPPYSQVLTPVPRDGLRLLSLDGGGVRGLSSLLILKEIMDRVNRTRTDPLKPYQIFDMIGGTSTGGLIATMLGRLEMNFDECIEAYRELATEVFDQRLPRSPIGFSGRIKAKFDSTKLESAIQEILWSYDVDGNSDFNDGETSTYKTFVCVIDCDTKGIVLLRDYGEPLIRASITQVALATSAAPSYFDTVTIDHRTFADGGLGANNPVFEVAREARDLWCPATRDLRSIVRCFISIGTGASAVTPLKDKFFSVHESLVGLVTETGITEKRFSDSWAEDDADCGYFRFSVEQGLQNIGLDEYKKMGFIEAVTQNYLEHIDRRSRLKACEQSLKQAQAVPLKGILKPPRGTNATAEPSHFRHRSPERSPGRDSGGRYSFTDGRRRFGAKVDLATTPESSSRASSARRSECCCDEHCPREVPSDSGNTYRPKPIRRMSFTDTSARRRGKRVPYRDWSDRRGGGDSGSEFEGDGDSGIDDDSGRGYDSDGDHGSYRGYDSGSDHGSYRGYDSESDHGSDRGRVIYTETITTVRDYSREVTRYYSHSPHQAHMERRRRMQRPDQWED